MKMLVITSCTGEKKFKPANQLQPEDFSSAARLRERTAELRNSEALAAEMYTGLQHRYLMEGLEQVREIHGQAVADLHIISAGYGLLSEHDVIVPYNMTFQILPKKEILTRSNKLQLHERVETLIADYKLVFFLLGKEYVQALQLPFQVTEMVTQIFLLGDTYKDLIPDSQNTHFVPAGRDLARTLGVMGVALKGFVFRKLCLTACREGFQVFEEVMRNPQLIHQIALGPESEGKQLSLW